MIAEPWIIIDPLPLQQPLLRELQHVLDGEDPYLVVHALELAIDVAQGAGRFRQSSLGLWKRQAG
jgi:hypothetical protein